ncbi:MAG: HEAT repeat domain-containing protein, partial [Okeania sp. SIO3B5]|uniref:HEAT repeat domain-containing protein n=1 Tax=Okeania sp. SIO3B5 TaxID=2607811 RepID=UPI0013FFB27B
NSSPIQISPLLSITKDFLDLLKQRVVSDDNSDVRQEAVRQIATGWKDRPEIFELLRQRLESDESWEVRREALEQITTGWKHELERFQIFELFQNSALNDPFEREFSFEHNPRQTALEAIVKYYPNHPQTLPLLQDRAANDSDKELREWAKKKLQRPH